MNRFFNNHDMNRIFTQLTEEEAKLGLSILLTVNHMPMLYYGDEIGMRGSKDPYDEGIRRPMEWCADNKCEGMTSWYPVWNEKIDGISVEEEQRDPNSILNYVKKMIRLRANNPTFAKGDIQIINIFGDVELSNLNKRALAYIVSDENHSFLVICNLHDETTNYLKGLDGEAIEIEEILLSDNHRLDLYNNVLEISCPGQSIFIAEIKK